jgi:hypothetical protein
MISTEAPMTSQKGAAVQAMPLQMASANSGTELQRPQNHEQQSRHNVDHGKYRMTGKNLIQGNELRGPGIRYDGRGIPANQNRHQIHDSSNSYRDTEQREEDDGAPQQKPKSVSWPANPVIFFKKAILYDRIDVSSPIGYTIKTKGARRCTKRPAAGIPVSIMSGCA